MKRFPSSMFSFSYPEVFILNDKLPLLKIFISLVFKFIAPQRNLKWMFCYIQDLDSKLKLLLSPPPKRSFGPWCQEILIGYFKAQLRVRLVLCILNLTNYSVSYKYYGSEVCDSVIVPWGYFPWMCALSEYASYTVFQRLAKSRGKWCLWYGLY
jgi:hypothetical protein